MAPAPLTHSRLLILPAPESLGASVLSVLLADALEGHGVGVRLGTMDPRGALARVYAERGKDGAPLLSDRGVSAVSPTSLARFLNAEEGSGAVTLCDASGYGRLLAYDHKVFAQALGDAGTRAGLLIIVVCNGGIRAAHAIAQLRAAVAPIVVAGRLALSPPHTSDFLGDPPTLSVPTLAPDTWRTIDRLGITPAIAQEHQTLLAVHRMRVTRWRQDAARAATSLGLFPHYTPSLTGPRT